MGKILEHLMTFVPTLPSEGELTLPNGSRIEFDNTSFSKILLGGDQLTVARVRGTAVKFCICGDVGIIINRVHPSTPWARYIKKRKKVLQGQG